VVLVAAVCPGMTLPSVAPSRDDSADPGGVVWLRGASRCWLLATCESVLGAAFCYAAVFHPRRLTARLVSVEDAEAEAQYGREQPKNSGGDVAVTLEDAHSDDRGDSQGSHKHIDTSSIGLLR
jgi:hypothetical protein